MTPGRRAARGLIGVRTVRWEAATAIVAVWATACTVSSPDEGREPTPPAQTSIPSPVTSETPREKALVSGTWGGPGALITFSSAGATGWFDCATGAISERVRLDENGHFSAPGWYLLDIGGPGTAGESPPPPHRASYRGTRSGSDLELVVELENGDSYGPFQLTLGAHPALERCV